MDSYLLRRLPQQRSRPETYDTFLCWPEEHPELSEADNFELPQWDSDPGVYDCRTNRRSPLQFFKRLPLSATTTMAAFHSVDLLLLHERTDEFSLSCSATNESELVRLDSKNQLMHSVMTVCQPSGRL